LSSAHQIRACPLIDHGRSVAHGPGIDGWAAICGLVTLTWEAVAADSQLARIPKTTSADKPYRMHSVGLPT